MLAPDEILWELPFQALQSAPGTLFDRRLFNILRPVPDCFVRDCEKRAPKMPSHQRQTPSPLRVLSFPCQANSSAFGNLYTRQSRRKWCASALGDDSVYPRSRRRRAEAKAIAVVRQWQYENSKAFGWRERPRRNGQNSERWGL